MEQQHGTLRALAQALWDWVPARRPALWIAHSSPRWERVPSPHQASLHCSLGKTWGEQPGMFGAQTPPTQRRRHKATERWPQTSLPQTAQKALGKFVSEKTGRDLSFWRLFAQRISAFFLLSHSLNTLADP